MTKQARIALFEGIPFVKEYRDTLLSCGFFDAPASSKYHGSYEGGLFDHSYAVMKALCELTESCQLKWDNPRSPYIVGMFHDLCKIDQYKPIVIGETLSGEKIYDSNKYEYNDSPLLKGHGDKSVMLLSSMMQLTTEEVLCIRFHMGAFTDKEEWRDYTQAIHECQNVLWTHTADMIAAHILNT